MRLGERKRVLRGMLRAESAGQSLEREAGRGTREQGKGQVQRGCHLGRVPWSNGSLNPTSSGLISRQAVSLL